MKNIPHYYFLFAIFLISILFLYILSPFFISIFLAFIVGHFFQKPYEYFLYKFNKKISVLITLTIIILVVVLPISLIIFLLSIEAQKNYVAVQFLLSKNINQLNLLIEKNAFIRDFIDNSFIKTLLNNYDYETNLDHFKEYLINNVQSATNYVFEIIKKIFLDITKIIINFSIMLYLVYFILQEGKVFNNYLKSFFPFKDEEKEEFISESIKVIDATIIGTLFIGIIEGVWGGTIFYLLDIPSPVTWGLIMTVLSLLPIVGTNSILLPVVLYQLLLGNIFTGVVVLLVGCGGVLINQNIIKPKLLGDQAGVHPTIFILSSLGGISLFGVIGFLIGPTVATLFIVIWKQFRNKLSLINSN